MSRNRAVAQIGPSAEDGEVAEPPPEEPTTVGKAAPAVVAPASAALTLAVTKSSTGGLKKKQLKRLNPRGSLRPPGARLCAESPARPAGAGFGRAARPSTSHSCDPERGRHARSGARLLVKSA